MSSRIRIRSGVLEWREVEGEVVALDLRSKTYLAVNRTGTAVWPALVSGADPDELVGRLVETFDVSTEQAVADVEIFLDELAEQDLLEPA